MSGADAAGSVRLRGIYTTALTKQFLDAGWRIVDASEPIERRFGNTFPPGAVDVSVETTDDRQGVGLAGEPEMIGEAASLLAAVGVDTFEWTDSAPAGTVLDGIVADTGRRGAVVDLGEREGYLPYGSIEEHVEDGDVVRVQVRTARPPWADDRPLLATELVASTGLVDLLAESGPPTVDSHDEAAARELVGMTDLLGVEAPDGWRIRWTHAATDASMDALRAALDRAADRAERLAEARETPTTAERDAPVTVATPSAGRWYWFGRESRAALDGTRRAVTTTMPGHHRTKAGTEAASAGVDFVEALCDDDHLAGDEFPFGVVADAFGPAVGDSVDIGHGKPDGRLLSLGPATVTERDAESVTVRRELGGGGRYDGLDVPKEAGDTATTTFREGRWWYPTVYRRDDRVLGTYVNVCTPLECFPAVVRYVDLHVDVLKHADGSVERVDDDELDAAVEAGAVSEGLAEKARSVASALESAL